jgi:hypothetical protein
VSYIGEGETSATYRPEPSIERVTSRATEALLVATGSLTAGRYGLFRWDMQARAGGPKPHFHDILEAFTSSPGTSGYTTVQLGGGGRRLPCKARGRHPCLRERADAAASMLILSRRVPERPTPRAGDDPTEGRVLSPEEWTELYARHDQTMV